MNEYIILLISASGGRFSYVGGAINHHRRLTKLSVPQVKGNRSQVSIDLEQVNTLRTQVSHM
ncbi:hypothetical protein MKY37_19735 [Psychrobacillus sp. FSL K6-2836]|uniref:hypothetical protein n=1 Tax=Psychrobacillus sp. FSL K6-2836 TaxID=2921548 RepID=UPI0030FC8BC8